MIKMFAFAALLTLLLCGSKAGYLKDIRVVYTKYKISKAADSVQSGNRRSQSFNADINSGFGGEFVCLVPILVSIKELCWRHYENS